MTTLTYLNLENNQLEKVPIITQLNNLNISDNPLLNDKLNFIHLRQMTSLTSLTINPSTVKQRVSLQELSSWLDEIIEFENSKKKGSQRLKLLKAQRNYLNKVLSFTNPTTRYCDVYTKLLLVFLPYIKEFNSTLITMNTKVELNQSILDTFQFRNEINLISQLETRIQGNSKNIKLGISSQLSYSRLERIFHTIKDPRQIDFSLINPGSIALTTKNGKLFVGCIHSEKLIEYETVFDSLTLGLNWGKTLNTSSKILVGSLDGMVSLFDTNTKYSLKTIDNLQRVSSLSINCDSSKFISSGYENNIFVFNFETMQLHRVLGGFHNDIINVASFSKKNPSILSACSYDRIVTCWDLRTPCRSPILQFTGQTPLTTTMYSDDDSSIVIGGEDGYVVDIDTRTVNPKSMKSERSWQSKNATRAIYSNSNNSILSIDSSDVVHVNDRFTGKKVTDLIFDWDSLNEPLNGKLLSIKRDPFNDEEYYFIRLNKQQEEKNYSLLKTIVI
ncbi:hypothetical protein EDI_252600 [Entamoeba dispar SAW760]|uniref:Uncharacterized protein n=1 Tax=Entamoeba dispar (strain ATCC PRA-260 / SAW760) TaxID=370354 RepID=B0EF65_ENTDS|nr:uncharacterized protein EDI_252600 [Entamoeba dispar SAW760]EDR26795.1 hypothetical protein EDI_252600 [Entamoeba dispar SAW760]|eukprot:EDR26795.1 hypothetical protein EDI_252600 [Entamoeba dispar SAW760]